MSEDFSNKFWTWYATDEYKLVLMVCELMKALEFLQAPASVQSSTIPYCPACETWSQMMLPIHDFLENFPTGLTPSLRDALSTVWLLSNELPDDAFHCDDYQMYDAPGWAALRSAASEALRFLEWGDLRSQVDTVMLECRKALFPHSSQNKA